MHISMNGYVHCTWILFKFLLDQVYITGFTFAISGIAARLSFSLKRVGKKVNWEQSKRLRTGNVVALTPAKDGKNSSVL